MDTAVSMEIEKLRKASPACLLIANLSAQIPMKERL